MLRLVNRTAMLRAFAGIAAATLLAINAAADAPPPGWRGDGTGRYPNATPPTTWSKADNVVWKTRLGRNSHTSLIVVGDRVFTMAEPSDLICVAADSGEILWKRSHTWEDVVGPERAAEIEKDLAAAEAVRRETDTVRKELHELEKSDEKPRNRIDALKEKIKALDAERARLSAYPSPNRGGAGNTATTPATDGRRVYASLGNGVVSAHSLDGTKAWSVFVQPPALGFGHASSPVIVAGRLIVQYGDLAALDIDTGKEQWRVPADVRYGSLATGRVGDDDLVVSPGGTVVRARDGEVLAEKLFKIEEASPCVADGVLYAVDAGRAWAYRLEDVAADGSDAKPLWQAKVTNSRRFASPLVFEGLLHTVSSNGLYDVLDVATGETVLRKRLDLGEGNVYASPTLAGPLLFLCGGHGRTIVARPGRDYDEVALNDLERFSGSPVFIGRRLYLRAGEWLYCIAEQ